MRFEEMRDLLVKHFNEMTKNATHLFHVNVDKDELWNTYLSSYPVGTNPIYRERSVHDCSACRHFIKHVGSVVTIVNNKVITIWDFETNDSTYQPVINALAAFVKRHAVTDVFLSYDRRIGCKENFEQIYDSYGNPKEVVRYPHFYVDINNKFRVGNYDRINEEVAQYRDTRNVFERSLETITEDSLVTVLDLIESKSLYRGEENRPVVAKFLECKREYDKLTTLAEKNNYTWAKSVEVGITVGRIRNNSIGTLLVDISDGVDLENAVRKFEEMVAPANYKRSKPIFTQRMLDDARKTIEDLGYMEALPRKYATLDDITVNNILFSNKDSAKRIEGAASIFDEMKKEVKSNPKKFDRAREVSIEDFIKDILPNASEVELYFENRHTGNMVSLIAPENKDAKTMFKWNNNFSWAYSGNVTDSMKERVKAAGGKVDGDLRFSIQWNDMDTDLNDLDAHCVETMNTTRNLIGYSCYEIFFRNARVYSPSHGMLDVDIINPTHGVPAVENITYADRKCMKDGRYEFYVHCFSNNGGRSGFRAEIEFDGVIHSFDYNKPLRQGEMINVASVTLDKGKFTIREHIKSSLASRQVWNLNTNQFVPVSVVMYSPNYWDEQNGIGNKHYMFMLKDCINPENPNGFYNEFLHNDLMKHRKVLEALGAKMKVSDSTDQLSGLGFSSTMKNDFIVKIKTNDGSEETIKVLV